MQGAVDVGLCSTAERLPALVRDRVGRRPGTGARGHDRYVGGGPRRSWSRQRTGAACQSRAGAKLIQRGEFMGRTRLSRAVPARRWLCVVAAVGMVAAACGGGGG